VATLCVVANLVVGLVAEPVGNLPVLLRLAGELFLDQECFVGRLSKQRRQYTRIINPSIRKLDNQYYKHTAGGSGTALSS
jgi:hypothetical protein